MDNPRKLVVKQAEDAGLWYYSTNINAAYLQQELRKLHDAVEHDPAMAVVDAAMAQYKAEVAADEWFRGRTNDSLVGVRARLQEIDSRHPLEVNTYTEFLEACRKYEEGQ